MKKIFLISVFYFCFIVQYAQVSFGIPVKINDGWKFYLEDKASLSLSGLETVKWQDIDLPHDWSVKGHLSPSLSSCTGYLPGGTGWYQKIITIPEEKKNEKLFIYFEGIYNRSEVFVNGEQVGNRPNGYISFMYDITPYVNYGKENAITVRVDHSRSADSRWYTGSGIYRNVWLVHSNPVHIGQWGVFAYPSQADKKQGKLHVEVDIQNESGQDVMVQVINELIDPAGTTVSRKDQSVKIKAAGTNKAMVNITVRNPSLWDTENPALYKLHTTVLLNGDIIDSASTITGFRTFTFDPDKGFALNGNWMKIKGVCIHHDAGVLGSAVPREIWRRRLLNLKKIGCNAIRTSHNPQAPDVYDLCDELGILVLNEAYDEWEFPKRKWLEGWNVGVPGFEGSYDFFEEWGEKDLADMVRRDRNHLSVFAWSIGNEVDYPNDPYSHPVLDGGTETGFTQPVFGGYKKDAPDAMRLGTIARKLVNVVKQYDKTRPVTAGLAGVAMSNETEYPGALDIAGYNYTENMYDIDHMKYPDRIIYGSENRHELSAWKAVTGRDFIFGQFLWTGIDYLGESGRWPSRGFYSGLLDFAGNVKPRGYFRQSLWSEQPMAYLGTYPAQRRGTMNDVWSSHVEDNDGYRERPPSMDAWPFWNYGENQLIRVVCYTNAAKARLELNGKIVGIEKMYDTETGIIYWDIPYEEGKLEVIGSDSSGKEVVRNAIYSSKRPYALKIIEADTEIPTNKGVSHIVLQVVDENGIPVMVSDNEITCYVRGAGKLLGLEAGNNKDMSDYTDAVHRVFNGRIVAYIQALGEGNIDVRFSSPWLQPAEITIQTK